MNVIHSFCDIGGVTSLYTFLVESSAGYYRAIAIGIVSFVDLELDSTVVSQIEEMIEFKDGFKSIVPSNMNLKYAAMAGIAFFVAFVTK